MVVEVNVVGVRLVVVLVVWNKVVKVLWVTELVVNVDVVGVNVVK